MAADKEFLDIFVRLKGEIKDLTNLSKGLTVNINVKISGIENLTKQIEKFQKGVEIPIKLKLIDLKNAPIKKKSKASFDDDNIFDSFLGPSPKAKKQLKSFTAPKVDQTSFDKAGKQAAQSFNNAFDKEFSKGITKTIKQVKSALGGNIVKNGSQGTLDDFIENDFIPKKSKSKGPKSVVGGSAQDRLNAQAFPAQSAEEAKSEFIQDRADKRRQSNIFKDRLRQSRLNRFRESTNLEEAQKEFDLSPTFIDAGEKRKSIAFQRGLLPGDIKQTDRKLIDPRRLLNKETVREIGFAGLFGGLPGLTGAIAGGSISPGGAFIGATIVEKLVQSLESAGEKIVGVFENIAAAGLQFEESVLSTSSSLQGFSQITDANGKPLGIEEQLSFQTDRARDIQTKARKRLLPLGISGNRESGIVGGVISALTQKNITDFTDDDITDISAKVGALIESQIPYLADSKTRVETEDFFLQPGRNTLLNTASRAFTGDIEGATSIDDIKIALQGISPIEEALSKNSNNAKQSLAQLSSKLKDIQTTAGDEFIQALVPAIQELTKSLADPELKTALVDIARLFGQLASSAIKLGGKVAGGIGGEAIKFSKSTKEKGVGGTLLNKGISALSEGLFSEEQVGGFLEENKTLKNILLGVFEFSPQANESSKNLFGGASAGKTKPKSSSKAKVAPRASFFLKNLLNPDVTKDLSGEEKSFNAQLADILIPAARKEGVNETSLTRDSLTAANLKVSGLEELRTRKQATFDTALAGGQAGQASFNIGNFQQQQKALEDVISKKQAERSKAQSKFDTSEGLDNRIATGKHLAKVTAELSQAEEDLAKNRVNQTTEARKLLGAFDTRESEINETFNSRTLVGQGQSLNLKTQRLDAERQALSNLQGKFSPDEFKRRNKAIDVKFQQNKDDKETQGFTDAQTFVGAKSALFEFNNLQVDLNKKLEGYKEAIVSAQFATKQATLAEHSTARALEDFKNEIQLRGGDRLQQEIGAAESLISNTGDADAANGLEIDNRLVRGSSAFDAAARKDFDLNHGIEQFNALHRKNDPFRVSQEESDQLSVLELDKEKAAQSKRTALTDIDVANKNLGGYSIEKASTQIDALKKLSDLKQITPENTDARNDLEKALSSTSTQEILKSAGFKDFGQFEDQLKKQREVAPGQFDDLLKAPSTKGNSADPLLGALKDIASLVAGILAKLSPNAETDKKLAEQLKIAPKPENVVSTDNDVFTNPPKDRLFGPQLPENFINKYDKVTGDYSKTVQAKELGNLLNSPEPSQLDTEFKQLEESQLSEPAGTILGGAVGGSVQPDVFSPEIYGKKFQKIAKPSANSGLSIEERTGLASDIFGGLTGAGRVNPRDIDYSGNPAIGSAILGGLQGSSPEDKLKSKLGDLAKVNSSSSNQSGTQTSNPMDGLLQAINTLTSVMGTTNPQAIGDKVKSALNSTFAGN